MVLVLSRFRVANGMQAEVAQAFRQRPRVVEDAPGFLWLEVFADSADPTLFYLATRWTDLPSFERWHASPAHRHSHALIPRGLKLDAAWTQVFRLVRLDGVTGPPLTEAVADATLLLGEYAAMSSGMHLFVVGADGTIRACNQGAGTLLEPGGTPVGKSLMDYMPEADAARLRAMLSRPGRQTVAAPAQPRASQPRPVHPRLLARGA